MRLLETAEITGPPPPRNNSPRNKCREGGYLCSLLYTLFCQHTTVSTPSFCTFWCCHPYIPLHIFLYNFWFKGGCHTCKFLSVARKQISDHSSICYVSGAGSKGGHKPDPHCKVGGGGGGGGISLLEILG